MSIHWETCYRAKQNGITAYIEPYGPDFHYCVTIPSFSASGYATTLQAAKENAELIIDLMRRD